MGPNLESPGYPVDTINELVMVAARQVQVQFNHNHYNYNCLPQLHRIRQTCTSQKKKRLVNSQQIVDDNRKDQGAQAYKGHQGCCRQSEQALGLVHSKISSQKKSKTLKNVPWVNDAKLASVTTAKYKYEVIVTCHAFLLSTFSGKLYFQALGTYALFLRPAHHASALYCQSCKAPQCLLSTNPCSAHGLLTKLTWAQ